MNIERLKEFKRANAKTFEQKVACLIDEKYSLIERMAIVMNKDKEPSKYEEFRTFVEECKLKVKNGEF